MLKFQEPMCMGVTSSQWKTFTTSPSRASIHKSTKTFREEETFQEMVVELPQPWNQSKTFWQGQKRKVVRNYPWLGSRGTYAPQCWSKAGRDQSCYLQEWTLGSTAQFTSQLTCLGNKITFLCISSFTLHCQIALATWWLKPWWLPKKLGCTSGA